MTSRTNSSKICTLLFSIFCISTATNSLAMHQILLTKLRDKNTSTKDFRKASDALACMLATYAGEQINTNPVGITTLCGVTQGTESADDVILVPIMRSGNTLLSPFLNMFEDARVGFILLQRNEETAEAEFFYAKLPKLNPNTRIIILEPMLATGGSMSKSLNLLTEMGIPADQIIAVCVVCAKEGLDKIHEEFPDVKIVYAAQDPELNNKKFIVPGLGDYGDRYYGTN